MPSQRPIVYYAITHIHYVLFSFSFRVHMSKYSYESSGCTKIEWSNSISANIDIRPKREIKLVRWYREEDNENEILIRFEQLVETAAMFVSKATETGRTKWYRRILQAVLSFNTENSKSKNSHQTSHSISLNRFAILTNRECRVRIIWSPVDRPSVWSPAQSHCYLRVLLHSDKRIYICAPLVYIRRINFAQHSTMRRNGCKRNHLRNNETET